MKLRNYVLNLTSGLGQNAVPIPLKLMDGDQALDSVDTVGVDEAGQWEYEVNGSPGRMYALISHGNQSRRMYSDVSLGRWGGWSDAEFYEFFGTFGSGVVANIADELAPAAAGVDRTFTIGTGLFLIDASPFRIYEPEIITVAPNASGSPRTDIVVIRKTRTGVNIWKTEPVIKTGSVVVTQDDDTWEEELFRVTVASGFTTVILGDIADNRVFIDVTPPTGLDAGATTTRTVAAADSSGLAQVIADYVCDGTNDEVQLEAAAAANGRVYCFNGNYDLDVTANLPSLDRFEGESHYGTIFTVNTTTGGFATDAVATAHKTKFKNFSVVAGSQDNLGIDARGYLDSDWDDITVTGFDRGIHLGGSSGTYTAGSTRNRVNIDFADCLVDIYIDGASADIFTVDGAHISCRNDLSAIAIELVTGNLIVQQAVLGEAFNAHGIVARAGSGQITLLGNYFEWASQKSDRYPVYLEAGALGGLTTLSNHYSAGCTKPHIMDLNGGSGRYLQLDANAKSATYPDGYVEFNTDAVFTRTPTFPNGLQIEQTNTEAFAVLAAGGSANVLTVDTDTDEGIVTIANGADLIIKQGANTWVLVDGVLGNAHFYQELRVPGTDAALVVSNDDGTAEYIKASSANGLQVGQGADLLIYNGALGGTVYGRFDSDGNLWAKTSIKVESTNVRALTAQVGPDTDDLVFAVDNTNRRMILSNGADFLAYTDDAVTKGLEYDGATGDFSVWGDIDFGTSWSNRHLIRGQMRWSGSAPTLTAGAGAGTGPSLQVSGNDMAGRVVLTTGTTPSASTVWTFTWKLARASENYAVMLYAADPDAAAAVASLYTDQATQSALATPVIARAALTASTSYHFWYQVMDFA